MLRVIFTVDYEIHGNGDGCPRELMVEPTDRMLRLFDEYGAKLTLMADVAEILKFREYKQAHGRDDYHYDAIVEQLCRAVRTGHDVQLHLHPSYFNASNDGGRWVQDWSEYDFARLPYERMHWMVRTGKHFLETLLRPVDPGYRCLAFRAANWCVSPTANVVAALIDNGIEIETSVFQYGRREGLVAFDYSRTPSAMVPWRVAADDICARDDASRLWEVPIYSELRWIGAFLTPGRVLRVLAGRQHRVAPGPQHAAPSDAPSAPSRWSRIGEALQRHAWKADFNQCAGRQLIDALRRASRRYDDGCAPGLPFVLIGHSKLFTSRNERTVRPLLAHSARHADRFAFDTLRGIQPNLQGPATAQGSKVIAPYVIVTPARNEAWTIERAIASMIDQTVRPLMWIIVDDNSSDGTADVVRARAAGQGFIRLVELRRSRERHFGNKVHAFYAGLAEASTLDYGYVGNLDADTSLDSHYFERVLRAFAEDPELGIAGGMVSTRIGDRFVSQNVALDSVAGAVQLFRRECFEDIGGYLPLPQGGVDAAAEIMARMRGWRVRTLADLRVLEHRRTGTASVRPVSSKVKEGQRLRSLGYGFLFLFLRCLYRSMDRPRIVGSIATLLGYLRGAVRREPLVLSPEVVQYLRHEQQRKLIGSLRELLHVRHLRDL